MKLAKRHVVSHRTMKILNFNRASALLLLTLITGLVVLFDLIFRRDPLSVKNKLLRQNSLHTDQPDVERQLHADVHIPNPNPEPNIDRNVQHNSSVANKIKNMYEDKPGQHWDKTLGNIKQPALHHQKGNILNQNNLRNQRVSGHHGNAVYQQNNMQNKVVNIQRKNYRNHSKTYCYGKYYEHLSNPDNSQRVQNGQLSYIALPDKEQASQMDYANLSDIYHRYVNMRQANCGTIKRIGNIQDGGWNICDDLQHRPRTNNCLVFSFGINFDFSFDDDIAQQYGCEVYSFDPSMKQKDHRRSSKVLFYATGLGAKNEIQEDGWPMKRFSVIRRALRKDKTPIDVLKMDIEYWELQVIPDMIQTGSLKDVKQFVAEFHIGALDFPSIQKYRDAIHCLKLLYDDGYRIIDVHENRVCRLSDNNGPCTRYGCHELSFIRL